ncbi:MAG: WD40 repeat domain-containing protein [Chloroflexota bacterium]
MLFIITGCESEVVDELFDTCLMNKNSEFAQSDVVKCDHRLKTGSQEFQGSDSTRDVQFSSDGTKLYTMSTLIQTWDVGSGDEINMCQLEDCHTSFQAGDQMFFDDADEYIGFGQQPARIYTGFTTKEEHFIKTDLPQYTHEAYIVGQDVFASYNNALIYFYDRLTGELVSEQTIEQGIVEVVGSVTSYATSIEDNRIVIWPVAEGMSGLVLDGHQAEVIKMLYSDDETLFLSIDRSGVLIVWDLTDGSIVNRWRLISEGESQDSLPTAAMALSADNELLVTRGAGRNIQFWSMATLELIAEVNIAKFGILDLDISSDQTKLAVGLSWAGIYDQNARTLATNSQPFDPDLLEPGDALILDISGLRP